MEATLTKLMTPAAALGACALASVMSDFELEKAMEFALNRRRLAADDSY